MTYRRLPIPLVAALAAGLAAATPVGAWDQVEWRAPADREVPFEPGLVGVGVDRSGAAAFFLGVRGDDGGPVLQTRRRPRLGGWGTPESASAAPAIVKTNAVGERLIVEIPPSDSDGFTVRARVGDSAAGDARIAFPDATDRSRISLDAALADSGRAVVAASAGRRVVVVERRIDGAWTPPLELSRGSNLGELLVAVNDAGDAIVTWSRGILGRTRLESRRRRAPLRWTPRTIVAPRPAASIARLAIDQTGRGLMALNAAGPGRGPAGAVSPPGNPRWSRQDLSRPGEELFPVGLAVDGAGRAVAIWVRPGGRLIRTGYAVGSGWRRTGAFHLTPGSANGVAVGLAVGPLGEVVMIAEEGQAPPVVHRRDPFGRWSRPVGIGARATGGPFIAPLVSVNAAGDAVAAGEAEAGQHEVSGYASADVGPRRAVLLQTLRLRPRTVETGSVPRIDLRVRSRGTILLTVHRGDQVRSLAGAIIRARAGRQVVPWPAALRAAIRRPGTYVLRVQSGERTGAAARLAVAFRIGS